MPAVENGLIDLRTWDFASRGPAALRGDWEFYWLELVRSTAEAGTDAHTSPAHARVPGNFAEQTGSDQQLGYASYRVVVLLPPSSPRLTLRLDSPDSSARVIWNGREVGAIGRPGRNREETVPSYGVRWIPLDVMESNELIIQVANFKHPRGGLPSIARLHMSDLAARERDARRALDAVLLGSIGVMGFYQLLVFWARRRAKAALWFGLFCLIISLRTTLVSERLLAEAIPYDLHVRLEYLTWYAAVPVFLLFMRALYPDDQQKHSLWLLMLISVPFLAAGLFTPSLWYARPLSLYQWITILAGVYCLWVVVGAVRRRRAGARITLVGWAFLFATIIFDIRAPGSIIWAPTQLFPLGLLAFVLTQAGVLARVSASAFAAVETLSADLKRMNTVKDQFLANLSHELNTPLTTIFGYAEMLRESAETPSARNAALIIYESAAVLTEQMNDLFLVTRLDAALAGVHAPVALDGCLRDTLSVLAPLAEAHSVAVQDNVRVSAQVLGAESILGVAFRNIVRNGILFNHSGGVVRIDCVMGADSVTVRIRDTGMGIAPEVLPRIFERFYRGDQSDTYGVSGVGLGLFIAKRIIDAHHGTIVVSSKLGEGTEVRVTLPLLAQANLVPRPAG